MSPKSKHSTGFIFGLLMIIITSCSSQSPEPAPTNSPLIAQNPSIPTSQPTSLISTDIPQTPTDMPDPPRTDGADTPEDAVIAFYHAIEQSDPNAYLDVIDPSMRSNIDNYFTQSQFLSALTQVMGLGGQLGKDSSKVSFRDISTSVIESQPTKVKVEVSGFIRSLAYATEQPLYDTMLVRKIGGRWFISHPTEQELKTVADATAQAVNEQERIKAEIKDKQTKAIFNAILSKGEFIQNMICPNWTAGYQMGLLQKDNQWMPIPGFFLNRYGLGLRFTLSPDHKLIAVILEDYSGVHGIDILDTSSGALQSTIKLNEELDRIWTSKVSWSPDGKQLIFGMYEKGIITIDISTQQTMTVWRGNAQDAIFLPNGRDIAISYEGRNGKGIISFYNITTGEEKKVIETPKVASGLVLSPDDTRIAYMQDDLWIINIDGSSPTKIVDNVNFGLPLWSPDSTLIVFHREKKIGLVPSDGTSPPIEADTSECTFDNAAWWVAEQTPLIATILDKTRQLENERTLTIGMVSQLHGVQIKFQEVKISKQSIKIHLSIKNTGEQGKVFLSGAGAWIYLLNQSSIQNHELDSHLSSGFTWPSDFPSVLSNGKEWEGWLEVDKSIPSDTLGIIVQLDGIEYEQPYLSSGQSQIKEEWTSEQNGVQQWYQSIYTLSSKEENLSFLATTSASSTLPDQVISGGKIAHYDPQNVLDNDFSTSWVEGKEDQGVGEKIVLTFAKPVTITRLGFDIGFDAGQQIFAENNRVRRVQLQFSDGSTQDIDFKDQRGIQNVPIENKMTTSLTVTILDVYLGTKYNDTAIAEIQVWGSENQ